MENNNRITAWLVRNCPDFYFMPSQRYDRIFAKWGEIDDKRSPAYWQTRGFKVEPMIACQVEEAMFFAVFYPSGGLDYWFEQTHNGLTTEAVECAKLAGKTVIPLKPFSGTVSVPHH